MLDRLDIPEMLTTTMNGDSSSVNVLRQIDHDQLRAAWAASSRPAITVEAVRRVLASLRGGQIPVHEAVLWALLISNGYLAPGGGPIRPLDIEYQHQDEDLIVELVGAMESFEDVDVVVTDALLDELISMESPPG